MGPYFGRVLILWSYTFLNSQAFGILTSLNGYTHTIITNTIRGKILEAENLGKGCTIRQLILINTVKIFHQICQNVVSRN